MTLRWYGECGMVNAILLDIFGSRVVAGLNAQRFLGVIERAAPGENGRTERIDSVDAVVEASLDDVFPDVSARRRNRLLLYAMRRYSSLRPIEIAQWYSRTPAAVTVTTKAIEAEALRHLGLARSLRLLAKQLQVKD